MYDTGTPLTRVFTDDLQTHIVAKYGAHVYTKKGRKKRKY